MGFASPGFRICAQRFAVQLLSRTQACKSTTAATWLCVHLHVCVCVCVYIYISVQISICRYVSEYIYIYNK